MRAYVYANNRADRALAVLDCKELSIREAKVPGHVDLSSIKVGMVVRPASEDRKPDMTRAHEVAGVNQVKIGVSTIKFHSADAPAKESASPASEK